MMTPSFDELPSSLLNLSSSYAVDAIKGAFSDIKRDKMIDIWTDDITATAVSLAEVYSQFTEKFYSSVLSDAAKKYREHYNIVHHLIPSADRMAAEIITYALSTVTYCEDLLKSAAASSQRDLQEHSQLKNVEDWADNMASNIIERGYSRHIKKKITRRSKCKRPPSSDGSSDLDNPHELYVDSLVSDLFLGLKPRESNLFSVSTTSSHSEKAKSFCSSCESISSGLLSPHSTADSVGLHRFADKLLYSLSALENGSNESLSSTDTTDFKYSIVDCYRRSSAPELRVSSRKSSLKTVFEEVPVEFPETKVHNSPKLKIYPATSLGRRLRSYDGRKCASMENIDSKSSKSSYSETLAKDILFSAYQDII